MAEYDTSFLVSYLAHEIRQPLYAIRSTLKEQELLECASEIDKILLFLNQTLSYMKDPQKNALFQFDGFTLPHLTNRIAAVYASLAREKNITFQITCEDSPYLYLYGDENMLFQIMNNLLMNAFKFTPEGGSIQSRLSVKLLEENRVSLSILVEDTGVGMSESELKKAFRLYESQNSSLMPGIGLGLPIVKRLAELLQGTVALQSKVGEGTQAMVELTLDASDEYYEKENMENLVENADALSDLRGIKILIAENDETIMENCAEIFEKAGAKVDKTYDGFEVVDLFEGSKRGEYQAILMDLEMPELDGITAARMIRQMKREDAALIPIFAYTGHFFTEEETFLRENQLQGILSKNITPQELTEKVSEFIR